MQKQELILVGGGGHCKSCIDVIECTGQYEIIGILDTPQSIGNKVLNYEIIGTDQDIQKYKQQGCQFLITVGQIKSASVRKRIFQLLEQNEVTFATIISPKAYVSRYANIGRGTIILHGATVNAAVEIGDNCILNTGCNIEHDVKIGNETHISTHAVINGGCIIGNEVFVGSNATLANQVNLGDNIIIGSGSVVIRSLNQVGTYVGNPVKNIN